MTKFKFEGVETDVNGKEVKTTVEFQAEAMYDIEPLINQFMAGCGFVGNFEWNTTNNEG